MTTLQVNSLPVLEVIRDLAKAFDTDFIIDTCQYTVHIPKDFGQGWVKAYQLSNGLGIIEYNCTFYIDLEIKFIVNEVHPLKFIYIKNGNLEHRFENEDEVHYIQEYQSAIVASANNYGHVLTFKANTIIEKFSIEVNRKIFDLNDTYTADEVNKKIHETFTDVYGKKSFYYKGDYSLNIADVFSNLKTDSEDLNGDKFVYKIYMESIAYKTLVLHLTQFLDDENGINSQQIFRKKEFEQLHKAIDYIADHIENYNGIDELTRETGLNSVKLQKGFKYLYNSTINQYVQEKRLEMARDLLINTDKSINEIVALIGLKSASYFSRVFKEKYGVQPSLFNKKI